MEGIFQARRRALSGQGRRGFTLVELIVVIVILAILAAIAIPALTGYITKAQDEGLKAEGRTVEIAAQVIGSDLHNKTLRTTAPTTADLSKAVGKAIGTNDATAAVKADWIEAINALASTSYADTAEFAVSYTAGNKIFELEFGKAASGKTAFYDGTSWVVKAAAGGVSNDGESGSTTLP